jgi:hypothetical protein
MAQDYLAVYRSLMDAEAPRLRLVGNDARPIHRWADESLRQSH